MTYGAIEAGGTKIVFGVGTETGDILEHHSIATTTPAEVTSALCDFFGRHSLQSIGVASFGPVVVDAARPNYGQLTTTPKLAWQGFNWVEELNGRLHLPVLVDTDVNAAALAENRWGAARGLRNCVYITVGTGIGIGAIVDGKMVHGLLHPEAGHLLVRRHPDDLFDGICPYHGDCLEGLASGPALEARWGKPGSALAEDNSVWEIEAHYLAHAVTTLAYTLSTEKVIVGGGVMGQPSLLPLIRAKVTALLKGYLAHPLLLEHMDEYIVAPGLGPFSGIKGALALAIGEGGEE